MHKPRQTSFGVWLFLVLAGLAFAVTMLNSWRKFNLEGPLDQSINVLIRKGSDLDDISRFLQDENIITDAGLFRLGVRILGNPRRLKAGEYAIPRRASARMIMDILMSGQTVVRRVQAAEGLTSLEIMEILDRSEGLANDEETVPINGALMPDTYHYSYGDSRSSMLARMKIEMDRFLDQSWKDRAPNLPLKDKWEALTLASIVERETRLPDERPRVASVFLNRIKRGMRLQSDPTVIYALTGRSRMDRSLVYSDLRRDHPYNTYVRDGLPPGPICNPGRAAILAVLHPERTEYFYFVADDSGGHVFSKNYAEHLKKVENWRKIQARAKTDAGRK